MRHAIMLFMLSSAMSFTWAETTAVQVAPTPATPTPVAETTATQAPTQPSLRQNTSTQATVALTPTALQQKHKQEIEQQNKRMALLENANQEALAQNQELQIKNDNLAVQIQVLQSERSAQMFLYGAVTFGAGILVGIIIYSLLYTRRRRSW